jgi:hypothetical protein
MQVELGGVGALGHIMASISLLIVIEEVFLDELTKSRRCMNLICFYLKMPPS